jgi:NADH:ubiquinone oxidoreductase subunit H
MLLFIVGATIIFILIDELLMSSIHRRLGPLNLGAYGLLASIINGINLAIAQHITTKLGSSYMWHGLELCAMIFTCCALFNYLYVPPFLINDSLLSIMFVVILLSSNSLLLVLCSFVGMSKYAMLGTLRTISQLISFELVFSTIITILLWSYNIMSLSYLGGALHYILSILLVSFAYICALVESNRLPFDLMESESELVAGFITDYSSI